MICPTDKKFGGGASDIALVQVTAPPLTTITCGAQTYTLLQGETSHTFKIAEAGTYTISVTNGVGIKTRTITVQLNECYFVEITAPLIPAEYQDLEYIESTNGQYIDTDYVANENTEYHFILQRTALQDYSASSFGSMSPRAQVSDKYWAWGNALDKVGDYVEDSLYKYNCYANITGVYDYVTNRNLLNFSTVTWASGQYSCFLFARSASSGGRERPCKMKLFLFEIKENGTMIKQFVPVRRKSDDKTGLYEVINNSFYTSQTSSDFVAGEIS